MKIHKLVALHDWQWYKQFVGGVDFCESQEEQLQPAGTVLCSDVNISKKIKKLYSHISSDRRVQVIVDSYLPCCAMETSTIPVEYMQMLYDDTPQFENLPDLGGEIRAAMVKNTEHSAQKQSTFLQRMLCGVLQGMRKNQQAKMNITNIDLSSVSILLNLLLATLLGLYPLTQRCTQWNARIQIYKRIHILLTARPEQQILFMQENSLLLTACIIEYICNIVHAYMPVEKDVLCDWVGGHRNFMKLTHVMDTFRWYHIENGNETWDFLRDAIQSSMQSISRNKRQCTLKKFSKQFSRKSHTPTGEEISSFLDVPHLTLFPAHRINPIEIYMDYQKLIDVPIPELMLNMEISFLPQEIVGLQLKKLKSVFHQCELVCNSIRTKHICLHCVVNNQSCELRYCQIRGNLICGKHPALDLIQVDMIGKILRVGNVQYILAPYDMQIQPYTGNSHKVWTNSPNSTQDPAVSCLKKKCLLCEAVNGLSMVHAVLHTKKMEINDVWLCHWHRPPENVLQYCATLNEVYQAALQWEKRNHRNCRPRRYSVNDK